MKNETKSPICGFELSLYNQLYQIQVLDPYPYWPPLIPGLKHLVATRPAVLLPRPHAHLAKICVRPKFNFDQGTRKQIMQFGCWGLGRALGSVYFCNEAAPLRFCLHKKVVLIGPI